MDRQYTRDDLLDQLRRCSEEYDHCTPEAFTDMENAAAASTVVRRFGSWKEAKEEAGIDEDLSHLTGRSEKYSDEQVLEHIRECARRNEGKCTVDLLNNEDDLVAPSVAVKRFSSWREAKERAGLSPDERSNNSRPEVYSDKDYLALIRECKEEHGKASQRLFDEDNDRPSAEAVRKRFGSWSEAKKRAGITSETRRYSDEELKEMLRECEDRYGKATVAQFAADTDFCSPETLQRRFGSWTAAKEAANIN